MCQEQTRIATAVSEIVRNAFRYATGGGVQFELDLDARPQQLRVVVEDRGPGIANLDAVLGGTFQSPTGMGLGIAGARRLMDGLSIDTTPAGTRIVLSKSLPPGGRAGHRAVAPTTSPPRCDAAAASWSARRTPAAEPGTAARRLPTCEQKQAGAHPAQSRARRYQSRRRRALRRTRRARRPPAPRRRSEVAVPLQHDARVPHAGERDHRPVQSPARGTRRRSAASRNRSSVTSRRRPNSFRPGQRPARPCQGRSRPDRGPSRQTSRSRSCSARCAGCCGRCC